MERPGRAVVAGMNSAPDWSGGEDGTVGPRGLCRGDLLLKSVDAVVVGDVGLDFPTFSSEISGLSPLKDGPFAAASDSVDRDEALADLDVVQKHLVRDAAEFEFLECDMQSLHVVLPRVPFSGKRAPSRDSGGRGP